MKPRDYQLNAVTLARESIKRGNRRIVICLPTGAGKTFTAAMIIKSVESRFKKTLFFADRRELIKQTARALKELDCNASIIMAGERLSPMALTQVASIQTYTSRVINGTMDKPDADMIWADECHQGVMAKSYQTMLAMYPDAIVIGLTATPDGKLGNFFTDLIYPVTYSELVAMGHLLPITAYCPTIPDLTGVRKNAGEYNQDDLDNAMKTVVGNVVHEWEQIALGKQTLVFAAGVQNSILLTEAFQARGHNFIHLDGTSDKDYRDEQLILFNEKKVTGIINCDLFVKGTDIPSIEVISCVKPTLKRSKWVQMCGRLVRPYGDMKEGILIDHSANTVNFGLLEHNEEWSLETGELTEAQKKEKAERLERMVHCRNCHHTWKLEGEVKCPKCGWVPVDAKKARQLDEKEGRLHKYEPPKQKNSPEQVEWNKLLGMGKYGKRQFTYSQLGFMYKKKFGVWPKGLIGLPSDWKAKVMK